MPPIATEITQDATPGSSVVGSIADSSFTAPSTQSLSIVPNRDYVLDISRYIPVGCLRIPRNDCAISNEVWKSCDSWAAFYNPRDLYNRQGVKFLLNKIEDTLLKSSTVHQYRGLLNAGWVRMEFKAKDQTSGQIRVYILPDDIGRTSVDREVTSLRRSMQYLLSRLDISALTWKGDWEDYTPIAHIDSSLDEKEKDDASLFQIFNTLPSPKPDPEIVADLYARDAMYSILGSEIQGLTTEMYKYQRKSAALMLQRESQPSQHVDPRLRPMIDQKGQKWFCDVDAGYCLREPRTYESPRGGICAETMGLGKTLICLALILATRELSSQVPVEYSVGTIPVRKTTGSLMDIAAATIGRTGTPWKGFFDRKHEEEGYTFTKCLEAIKKGAGYYLIPPPPPRRASRNPVAVPPRKIWLTAATIIVIPPNLVKQWVQEITKHTTGVKYVVFNKSKQKLPPAQELAEFDIILFSRQRFDQEAKDGSDATGRRQTSASNYCNCPYIGSTRVKDCTCFREEDVYRSPLKDLHFKRLITDEGHTFGNASRGSMTDAAAVVDFLQVSARWIVSGTPTDGLYGAEVSMSNSAVSSSSGSPSSPNTTPSKEDFPDSDQEKVFYRQERKDLEKLGNIATCYLKTRPWANTSEENDVAVWSHHVMQPRHGSKSRGNMDCLRSTLEGMIIRHRPEDVEKDVILPPLNQSVVYLDGCMQDKMSLNLFSMMIVSNAITSERKDADYLFHPRQRAALDTLVKNLRQASFLWSGLTMEQVQSSLGHAKSFLEKREVPVSIEDEILLQEVIRTGEIVLANHIKRAVFKSHEMPIYIQNDWSEDDRMAWSLDKDHRNPTLMGATMIHSMQKHIQTQLWKENPMEGLASVGEQVLKTLAANSAPSDESNKNRKGKQSRSTKKADQPAPALAGGVTIAAINEPSPRKRARTSAMTKGVRPAPDSMDFLEGIDEKSAPITVEFGTDDERKEVGSQLLATIKPKSAMKRLDRADIAGTLDSNSPLAATTIVSTGSTKLSYLIDRIMAHHKDEKILVFYEEENVGFYIAQALEFLHIKHLIYAKTLSSDRKSQYVVTFNQTETFRVLLMDISQAALGLDMSSASRVWFVNPVFSPMIEAQAVKRAHRIGQKKPVFVETLILKGSIEEAILERRKDLSNEEHKKCKNILDDQKMYHWIRNARFMPIPYDGVPGPDQMAKLETPQLVFGAGSGKIGVHDPDADLLVDDSSPKAKRRGQRARVLFEMDETSPTSSSVTSKGKGKSKAGLVSSEDEDSSSVNLQKGKGKRKATGGSDGIFQTEMKRLLSKRRRWEARLTNGTSSSESSSVVSTQPEGSLVPRFTGLPMSLESQLRSYQLFQEGREDEGEVSDEFERFNRVTKDRPKPLDDFYPDMSEFTSSQSIEGLPKRREPPEQVALSLPPPIEVSSSSNELTSLQQEDNDKIEYVSKKKYTRKPTVSSSSSRRVSGIMTYAGWRVLGSVKPWPSTQLPPTLSLAQLGGSSTSSGERGLASGASNLSDTSPSSSRSDKAQSSRIQSFMGVDGKKSLIVNLSLGKNASRMQVIEEQGREFRLTMEQEGIVMGKTGWETST